jgi:hypothetical protein
MSDSHSVRSFSYGGGTQSTAALVLAARREIDYPLFIFANVGDDSEMPHTLTYVREIAIPYGALHGIEVIERTRGGVNRSLLHKIERLESTLPIPVRMNTTGAPGRRSCTQDFKIEVVNRELKARGATAQNPAIVGLGITADESGRIRSRIDPRLPNQLREYPLAVDLGLTRHDCERIILDAGLPLPGRSACWFCPYHSGEEWARLRREHPELFEASCELEELLQRRRAKLGRDPVWLTDQGAREKATLRVLYEHDQLRLIGADGSCDGGYCMT